MSEELKDIALAEAYLNNELNEAQRQQVEQRRSSDPTFAQLLDDLEVMLEGTREAFRGDIEAQLREMEDGLPPVQIDEAALLLDDLPEEVTQTKAPPKPAPPKAETKRLTLRNWLYIAAAVAIPLIIIAGWWLWPGAAPHERLFAEHFEAPARVGGVTRGGDEVAALRQEANAAYDAEEFAVAMQGYQRLFEEHRDTQALFYLGVAQLGAGAPTAAIESLEEFGSLSDDIRFEDTKYYIALAFLKKGEEDKALSILEKESHPKADRLEKAILQQIIKTN